MSDSSAPEPVSNPLLTAHSPPPLLDNPSEGERQIADWVAASSLAPAHLGVIPDSPRQRRASLRYPPAAGTSSSDRIDEISPDLCRRLFPAVDAELPESFEEPGQEIEMPSIDPSGHRRRRSSLVNAIGNNNSVKSRSRAPSLRSPLAAGFDAAAKIEEEISVETNGTGPLRARDDESMSNEDLHDDEETGLSSKDRRRKRKKRWRNTLLDQRVVREKMSDQERKDADQSVVMRLLINTLLIGLWYVFSLCISLYNKWMFDENKLNFSLPLFTTSFHMLVQFSLASLVLYFIPSLRPEPAHKPDPNAETDRPLMTKMFYLTRIGPCGAATGLDIGLGNTSLKFITLTFYTMCKSSSLAFVLVFAFLFRLEVPTWKLVAIIATMTVGVVMMVAGEVEFKLGGFILVISAAFFSGFRWALTQILLLRNPATSNPFSSIFFLAPVMFLTLVAIAIPVEGVSELAGGLSRLSEEWGVLMTILLILFPGTIAFFMTASEFALLQRTSVVTLSIAGIFKEAVTISAAAIVFGDRLTAVNIAGLFITLGAIVAYNYIKIRKMREEAQVDAYGIQAELSDAYSAVAGGNSGRYRNSPADSSSDADGEDGLGEEGGLLRPNADEHEHMLFTADGDMVPKPEAAFQGHEAAKPGIRED